MWWLQAVFPSLLFFLGWAICRPVSEVLKLLGKTGSANIVRIAAYVFVFVSMLFALIGLHIFGVL